MKKLEDMSAEELAGLVCEALLRAGITTTLSGGGCVAIWSEGKYVSRDLDFIEEGPVPRQKVKAVLAELGFVEEHRYFVHPDTEYFVEFPTGPLTVGDERVDKVAIQNTNAGRLRLLAPKRFTVYGLNAPHRRGAEVRDHRRCRWDDRGRRHKLESRRPEPRCTSSMAMAENLPSQESSRASTRG